MKNDQWKVVDRDGQDVLTAQAVDSAAKLERIAPRKIAQREARNLVNVAAGDDPVYAIRA